ncbi:MAG: SprT-like domain-containing protein [Muribaculaceae bacterium]|nr:SprT-like domain-containing protein [Muribaculaceae bacterium]
MKLSLEYLNSRHAYWKERIGEAGIWESGKFGPVTIVIRPDCKSYNGLFIRKYLESGGKRNLVDRIFIYNKVEDFDPGFLDNILVHEMIHQYIIQNKLKDRGPHGPLFRGFMQRINAAFGEELKIRISDRNPGVADKPKEKKRHLLLVMHLHTGFSFCSVINPNRIVMFEQMVKRNSEVWRVKEHYWAYSDDTLFNDYSRCTRSLHGIKKPSAEMEVFCREHGVVSAGCSPKNAK